MTILLLGANGQVGRELQRALPAVGDVRALDRAKADLSNPDQLRDVVRATTPKIIVNAAAYTAVDKAETEKDSAERINHTAVAVLAEEARRADAALVHYSTDYVYDGTKPSPYVETDATNPISVYGATKLRGEDAIRASGCRHIIFRTSWVYAVHGHNFVKTMLRLAKEREELTVVADQFGAPTSADLIADVTAKAISQGGLQGVYHLVAGGETTWHGFARFILAEAQKNGVPLKAGPEKVKAIPTSAYPTPAKRPANSRLNTDKLKTALKIELPDWDTPARRVVAALSA
ncbi:MAG: dTDP-4-dehydrorhamnose reductase [Rhodospirillaceae bacterium]|nr:dTDP-4-dehydrorhamnose reductase [Rhodospirillaceae bacterium]